MIFCKKCGSIMMPKKDKKGVFVCSCGFEKSEIENSRVTENMKNKEEISVVEKDEDPSPLVDAECKKCGHNKARFWTVQTRASDEPETKFFRCEYCNHTWRDYD